MVEKILHFLVLTNFCFFLHQTTYISSSALLRPQHLWILPEKKTSWACSLWFLRGFAMWLCWNVIPPEQNSRPGQPMTSHKQRPSQTSHNKQLSVATLCLWCEEAEMSSVSLFLSSSLPFLSFSLWHLLISLFPLLLSRCIKWGDYSGSVGLHLKVQSVKRAFLSFPLLSLPSPHLLYSPFSFPFILFHPLYSF